MQIVWLFSFHFRLFHQEKWRGDWFNSAGFYLLMLHLPCINIMLLSLISKFAQLEVVPGKFLWILSVLNPGTLQFLCYLASISWKPRYLVNFPDKLLEISFGLIKCLAIWIHNIFFSNHCIYKCAASLNEKTPFRNINT